jgi:hypothetical protein
MPATKRRKGHMIGWLGASRTWLLVPFLFVAASTCTGKDIEEPKAQLHVSRYGGSIARISFYVSPSIGPDSKWSIYIDTISAGNMLDSGVVGQKGVIKTTTHRFTGQNNHFLCMVITDSEDRILNVIHEEFSAGDHVIMGEAPKYVGLMIGGLIGFLFTAGGVYLQEHVYDRRTRRTTLQTAQMRLLGAIRGLRDNWESLEYDPTIEDERQLYYVATYFGSPDTFLSVLESYKRIAALRRAGRATVTHKDELTALEGKCRSCFAGM